ncbi:MAG: hypothetical protein KGL79_05260 [Acidobacteriota bacterium]|nr:hypothetical protein [Acidobacteriota bacterium]
MTDAKSSHASKVASGAADLTAWQPSSIILLVMVVLAALISLTVYLVQYFRTATDVTAVLGAILPAFTAAFGLVVGHQAGTVNGAAKGRAATQKLAKVTTYVEKLPASDRVLLGLSQNVNLVATADLLEDEPLIQPVATNFTGPNVGAAPPPAPAPVANDYSDNLDLVVAHLRGLLDI